MSVKNDFDGFFREAKVSKKKKFVINVGKDIIALIHQNFLRMTNMLIIDEK